MKQWDSWFIIIMIYFYTFLLNIWFVSYFGILEQMICSLSNIIYSILYVMHYTWFFVFIFLIFNFKIFLTKVCASSEIRTRDPRSHWIMRPMPSPLSHHSIHLNLVLKVIMNQLLIIDLTMILNFIKNFGTALWIFMFNSSFRS